jgi:hypothetical protein
MVTAPNIMYARYTTARVRKSLPTESPLATQPLAPELGSYIFSSAVETGLAIRAPPPKPMMAMPVARPGRSGNHLIRVETGEM